MECVLRFLPYVFGLLMLAPLFIWAALWFFAFPGPKPGFDVPVVTALVVTSLPLAAWHYVAVLGFVANSIAGRSGDERPLWTPARLFLRAMPATAVITGLAGSVWLAVLGDGWVASAAPALSGLVMAWIMGSARRPERKLAAPFLVAARGLNAAVSLAGRGVLMLPLIGGLLREIGRDPHRAAPYILINLAGAATLAAFFFGPAALALPAMMLAPVAFYLLFVLTIEDA